MIKHKQLSQCYFLFCLINETGSFILKTRPDYCYSLHKNVYQASASTTTSLPNTSVVQPRDDSLTTKNEETAPFYLASKSKSTSLLIRSPSIGSFTLVKNWNEKTSLRALTAAVNAVVEDNPILTGQASADLDGFIANDIRITPGAFLPNDHAFVEEIDILRQQQQQQQKDKKKDLPSVDELVVNNDELGQIKYIDKYVAPLVRDCTKTTLDQIKLSLPLLEVKVILLPDDYACIYINISHSIGDLVTYVHILEQISLYDNHIVIKEDEEESNNKEIDISAIRRDIQKNHRRHSTIDWDNPLIPEHEIFPDEFSQQDIQNSYGFPFLLGVTMHIPGVVLRKKEYMLLSRKNIKAKIDEFQTLEEHSHPVGSNDVITAALCDANRSTDIFALTKSMRGITPNLSQLTGGNLHCEVPFHRVAGRNPYVIRDIINKGKYFERNEMPFWSSLVGRVGRITNCVTPTPNAISFGGRATKTICHFPPKHFLDFCPLDTAVIFRLNKDTFGILHNFQDMIGRRGTSTSSSNSSSTASTFLYDLEK